MAKRIMIIDDEQHVLTYLETLFKDRGYEVSTAMDGIEGWERIKASNPDLITLDIVMPNQSGVGLYQHYFSP